MMRTTFVPFLLWTALLISCQSSPSGPSSDSPAGALPEGTNASTATVSEAPADDKVTPPSAETAEASAGKKEEEPSSDKPAANTPDLAFTPRTLEFVYEEIVTGHADREAPLPLIIALHGRGDSPAGFAPLLDQLPYPARILLPRAPDAYGKGFSWFHMAPGGLDAPRTATAILEVLVPLANWIETMAAQRPTVGKPVITGFSQGGMLSFALAMRNPSLIAAAIPLGGALPRPLWRLPTTLLEAPPLVYAVHGEEDRVLPVDNPRGLVGDLNARGYQAQLRSYPGVGHSLTSPMRRDIMEVLIAAMPRAGTTQSTP